MQPSQSTEQPIPAVGGLIYRQTKRGHLKVLLIKKHGGTWTLPKGHVEPGEPELAALTREIFEETGLHGTVEGPIHTVIYPVYKGGQHRLKRVRYYLVRATGGTVRPNKRERICKARWVPPDKTLQRIRIPRVRTVVMEGMSLIGLFSAPEGEVAPGPAASLIEQIMPAGYHSAQRATGS